jgi:glycosyltransferase involved in cell wall biosynthesis
MERVSVIVPFHTGLDSLRQCLRALGEQSYPSADVEIIAVDNGCSEDTAAVKAEFPHIRWLAEGQPGSYAARNRGIQNSTGEILAFTDADCVPAPTWLQEAVAVLKSTGATIVGGRIDYLNPPDRPLNAYELVEEEFFLLARQRHLVERVGVAATANVVTRRAVFDRVGLFDPGLKSLGDGEWVKRATGKGEILRYAEGAVVFHPRRSSFQPVFRKVRRIAGGRMLLLKRQGATFGSLAADVYSYCVLNPRMQRYALFFPKIRGLRLRIHMFFLVEILSLANTAEKVRVLCGGKSYRG